MLAYYFNSDLNGRVKKRGESYDPFPSFHIGEIFSGYIFVSNILQNHQKLIAEGYYTI